MKDKIHLIVILFISGIALFINVDSFDVMESSEARYAEIAREMNDSGDYFHPSLLNIHHYHKPPLTYDITLLAYKIFGVNDFSTRFFLQIAILLQLLLIYKLAFLLFKNRKTALWSVMIYFSFPIVLISTRNLTTDAFLTTFVIWSIFNWVKYRQSANFTYLYLFAFSLALGFLTKGPVVFLVPFSFILFFNQNGNSKNKLGVHHVLSLLLFVVIAFSWFVYLSIQNSDFIDYFLHRQTIDRFSKNVFNREEPFWYFLALAPLLGVPWLLILPYLIFHTKNLFKRKSVYIALAAGVIIPLIIFSISTSKRVLYILPFYGLLAILITKLISQISLKQVKGIGRFIFIFTFCFVFAFSAMKFIKTGWILPNMYFAVSIITLAIMMVFYKAKRFDTRNKAIYLTFVFSLFLVVEASGFMSRNQNQLTSIEPINFIKENGLESRDILIYNSRKPSIAFGLRKSIISLNDGNELLNRETQFEENLNWKKTLIDMKNEEELDYLKLILKKPTVLIVYKHEIHDNQKWILSYYKNKEVMNKWIVYY